MQPVRLQAGGYRTTVEFARYLRLPHASGGGRHLFVFDTNTDSLFGADARPKVVIPAGEEAKSWASVDAILTAALEAGLTRQGVMVGVGGGVVGDLTAFAASIYMRGVAVTLVPTTLLAMVDASVGGKSGINYGGYKNMVGTFHPASEVHVGISALESLPEREYHSGLAEVIKTAALGDEELFVILEDEAARVKARDPELLGDVVRRCVVVKTRIVEQDLTEKGLRAWLNLGHTFAHALESVNRFSGVTHGEAVAWGMGRAVDLGRRLGLTDPAYGDRLVELLRSYDFQLAYEEVPIGPMLKAMGKDKKTKDDGLRFVLQENMCRTSVVTVDPVDVEAVL